MATMAIGSPQTQMGIFTFERNGISGCIRKPFSPIGFLNCGGGKPDPVGEVASGSISLNPNKKKKLRVTFRVINSNSGGGILEKDFQFKPSFDEYLKTMELVREKKYSSKSNSGNSKRKFSQEQNQVKVKMKTSGSGSRNSLQLPVKSEVDEYDLNAKADEYQCVEPSKSNHVVFKPQVSPFIKKIPNLGRYDSKSKRGEEEVKFSKSGEFPGQVKMSKVVKYSELNMNSEGVRRITSKKAFPEESEDDDLTIERAAFNKFEESNDVVDKPRVSKMEMEERVKKLAKSLNGADIDMPEWMFSKMVRSAKIKFTDYCILRLIQILGKLGNWRRVLQVIEWLQMRERFKSHRLRHIYTAALDVLGKARRPVEALNVFHSMQQQMASYPDIVSYHSIAVTLGQAGHMKELFDVIDSMRSPPKKKFRTGLLGKWDPRLEPDIVVYNAVLNACVRRKQWEGAFWVLQQLKQKHLHPSTTTHGLIMEVMFACGKYHLVYEFFRKIEKSSIPNALTYRVLVNTLWKEDKIDEAVMAVQSMEKRGIVGSAALYYDLGRCLCSAGRCQEALMQIEKICKVANKPLVVTYTGLIQACLDSGSTQNGTYIFKQMQKFCSPNLVTCNIMLKAYLDHGKFDQAKDLFQKMSEDANEVCTKSDYLQVIPDTYTFNIMLDACVQLNKWDEFEYVYGRMLHHGFHFNAKRHLRMILDAVRAGKAVQLANELAIDRVLTLQGELLETTWEHMTRAGRAPPLALIKERFCIKLEKNDYISAVSCFSIHLGEGHAFSKTAWFKLFKDNACRFRPDMIVGIVDEVDNILSTSNTPDPVLQNLLTACKEFLRTHLTSAK